MQLQHLNPGLPGSLDHFGRILHVDEDPDTDRERREAAYDRARLRRLDETRAAREEIEPQAVHPAIQRQRRVPIACNAAYLHSHDAFFSARAQAESNPERASPGDGARINSSPIKNPR